LFQLTPSFLAMPDDGYSLISLRFLVGVFLDKVSAG